MTGKFSALQYVTVVIFSLRGDTLSSFVAPMSDIY